MHSSVIHVVLIALGFHARPQLDILYIAGWLLVQHGVSMGKISPRDSENLKTWTNQIEGRKMQVIF